MSNRSGGRCAILLVFAVASLVAVPATASAATLWVSNNAPSAPFNTCAHPGYSHIQQALGGPGTSVHVCAGKYAEQLQIERPITITGYEGATVELPSVTAAATTKCDVESDEASPGRTSQDEISICGEYKVVIKNLTVKAIWPGEPVGPGISCAYRLFGVLAAGGANLELSGSTVIGAAPKTINGCQYGVGVEIGMSYTAPVNTATAKLSKDTISGYQKNGITVSGEGSSATIISTTVTGAGPQAELAQNGIGVQYGGKATITTSDISGNDCNQASCGPEALTQAQSDGVYFYEAGTGSSISKSVLTGNDVGVEAFDGAGVVPLIANSKLESNRWEAVAIGQGAATVNGDLMTDSNVGIEVLQFAGQAAAPGGTATHDKIEGMKEWAVFGHSDKQEGDLPGAFSITSSKISGNPGAKPLESVESDGPTLKIYAEKDS